MTHVSARSVMEPMESTRHGSKVGRDGVDHLMNLLAHIKSRGWNDAFSEDFMYGQSHRRDSGSPPSYSEPLLSLRQSLEDSKLCMEVLQKVRTHLGRKIRHLQRRGIPLVLEDGIKRLPDELLANIFEAGFQTTEDSEFSVRVSHVSRRFRDISLRTPQLWTRLSTGDGLAQIHAFLSRSADFDISVEIKDSRTIAESSLRALAPHSDRWSHLTQHGAIMRTVFQELRLFDLPRLRYLCHRFPLGLSALNLPVLSHIKVEDDSWQHNLPFRSQLTHVDLLLHDFDSYDMDGLARTLYHMNSLRDLSLEFVGCVHHEEIHATYVNGPPEPHCFPIESLNITIGGFNTVEFVTRLYEALSYFVTTTVDIFVQTDPPVRDTHMLIFGLNVELFPYASTISLHTALPCDPFYILETIGRHCDLAQSVRFDVPTFNYLKDNPGFQNLGSIQHLHFQNCDGLSEKVVETLAKNLSLRTLEITRCKMISEEFLLNLSDEFREKIKWNI